MDLKQSCLNGASGLDCGAQAVVLQEQTGQTVKSKTVVNVAVGGLAVGSTLAVPFRIRNAAAKDLDDLREQIKKGLMLGPQLFLAAPWITVRITGG